MFLIYGNDSSIVNVLSDIENNSSSVSKRFYSIHDALEYLCREYSYVYDILDLSVRYYTYDSRICRRVYLICTSRHGKINCLKRYGTPQFVSYMIDLNEKNKGR